MAKNLDNLKKVLASKGKDEEKDEKKDKKAEDKKIYKKSDKDDK